MAKPVLETPKVYTTEQLPKTAVISQAQSLRDLGTNIDVGLNSLLKYAREEADRQGVREGNTALLSDVLTIDPTTGSSKALSGCHFGVIGKCKPTKMLLKKGLLKI